MNKQQLLIWSALCATTFAALLTSAVAQTVRVPAAAPNQQGSLVRVVTDGKPWTMTSTDAPGGEVTFTPDGTGRMVMGTRSLSPTWREGDAGQFCIKPMQIFPERCATLRREGTAIVGLNNGQVQFRLTRP
jgi:hypothetical protein